MTQGRKPQTPEQKRAKGETRPCRLSGVVVEMPVCDTVPQPPEWLEEEGKALWHEIAPMLYAQRVLTKADIPALIHMCAMHASHIRSHQALMPVTASESNALRGYFAEFGMTPSSRTKLAPAKGDTKGNKFAGNGRQAKA